MSSAPRDAARVLIVALGGLLLALVGPSPLANAATPARVPDPALDPAAGSRPRPAGPACPDPETANPWTQRRIMDMAHSGGEAEAPMNTMYAFKRATRIGADMLELDVQSTKDDHLVVIHDAAVDETTDGTGYVKDKTLGEIKALDAAYWFVPGRSALHGRPDSSSPLRGARHGHPKVLGYQPKDFEVPTLAEVFKRFPDTPVNIEIKGTSDTDEASFLHTARLLADLVDRSGRCDLVVASFNDPALALFHRLAPRIGLSPGQGQLIAYFLGGVRPMPGTVALQIPVTHQGIGVATPEFIRRAHADGYAVHVWFSGTATENATTYNRIVDACADGLMPAYPSLLEHILDQRGMVRPGTPGADPCR